MNITYILSDFCYTGWTNLLEAVGRQRYRQDSGVKNAKLATLMFV
jgi:hypothetical protein